MLSPESEQISQIISGDTSRKQNFEIFCLFTTGNGLFFFFADFLCIRPFSTSNSMNTKLTLQSRQTNAKWPIFFVNWQRRLVARGRQDGVCIDFLVI